MNMKARRSGSFRLSSLGCLVAGLSIHPAALAAWDFVPDLGLDARVDENIRMQDDAVADLRDPSPSTALDAGVAMTGYNERGFVTFEPRLYATSFSDELDSELDATNVFLYGNGEYNWVKAGTGFEVYYARESILYSELVEEVDADGDPDTENPDPIDTGRTAFINQDRKRLFLRPFLDFQVSELNTLKLQLIENNVDYSGLEFESRTGYVDRRFSAGIIRNANERNQVSATVWFENYEADANQNDQDTVRIEGAFARPLSPLWTFTLKTGVLRTDFSFVDNNQMVDNASTDYTFGVGLSKRSERSSVNLALTRDAYPTATGFSVIRDEAYLYFLRDLTTRVVMSTGFRLAQTRSLDDVDAEDDRDYAVVELSFEWVMRQALSLRGGISYAANEFVNEPIGKTDGSGVFIGIVYRGVSRRAGP
jgi:hypothetical protein